MMDNSHENGQMKTIDEIKQSLWNHLQVDLLFINHDFSYLRVYRNVCIIKTIVELISMH